MFHVQKVSSAFDGGEVAITDVVGEQPGVGGSGVFVPFAVHEHDRYVDALGGLDLAVGAYIKDVVDVVVHLRVFVQVQ